jgi:alpha-glucosidase
MTMLDVTNTSVLSYVRSTGRGAAVVVAQNFTAQPQTISLDLAGTGLTGSKVYSLLTDDASLQTAHSLKNVTLPPFTSWIASVE